MEKSISHISNAGYILVKEPDHPLSDKRGYILEHRFIASGIYGISAIKNGVVHHLDGDRTNNSPENLQLFSSHSEHMSTHRSKNSTRRAFNESNPIIRCACGCGNELTKYSKHNDRRYFIHGHSARKYFGCKIIGCKFEHRREGFCKKHQRLYSRINLNPKKIGIFIFCKCGCETKLLKYDRQGRERKYVCGHHKKDPEWFKEQRRRRLSVNIV